MATKIMNIAVPIDWEVPELINTFAPEENAMILTMGTSMIREARNVVAGLSQTEIYNKIRAETSGELKRLETDLLVQKKLNGEIDGSIRNCYEKQLEQLNKQIIMLRGQINTYEMDSRSTIETEVNKMRANYDLLLEEKDKQNQLNREVFDKAEKLVSKNVGKSSISIGDDGEHIFEYLSDTFKDFTGYKIENKSKQGHKGDFHLFFDEFNVLVDSKNYSSNVQKKEVNKIEADLMTNDNMTFAWMVSLNTNICEYNRFPIMSKWIRTEAGVKCILFINNLLEHKDPKNILRQAWFICCEFNKLTKRVCKEDGELTKYREKELVIKKQIENLQERCSELRRSINASHNVLKQMDSDLLELLSLVSNKILNDKFDLNCKVKEWWEINIEYVSNEYIMTSTEIWNKFKKHNKDYISETKLTIDMFKDIISNFVSKLNYTEKTKKGAIEFTGITWKQLEETNNVIENLIIKTEEVTKIKKGKKDATQYYFSEEQDNKIINDYKEFHNDIISISETNNVKPWQIVSLLMRYKIITKRDNAKGYEKYKETEEYKNKISETKL
jgi:hypothetical protein